MDSTIVLFIVVFVKSAQQFFFKSSFHANNEHKCKKLLKVPRYSDDLVMDHAWRHYYTWNILNKECLVTEFEEATAEIIDRFALRMKDFVEEEPVWDDAVMLAKTGVEEMLMIHDEGPVGRYKAIKSFSQMGDIMYHIQTQRFALKMANKDKFLIMLDCRGGVSHIMAKVNDTVSEKEILNVAASVKIGKGYIGCTAFLK